MGLPDMSKEELESYLVLHALPEWHMMREQLMAKGIDEYLWPVELQGDWEERTWVRFGFEAKKLFPPPSVPHPQMPGIVSIGQPMQYLEPRIKPKTIERAGNPFRSDKFGTLLGDDDDEPRGLGNRGRGR